MDIERGQGPNAPSLGTEVVQVGDVLTLVFTLADDVFWFDSNILSCYAFDGVIKNDLFSGNQSKILLCHNLKDLSFNY